MPTFFIVLATLVVHPPSRMMLFPPAPIALVDTATGGTQKPKAGHLGSDDSATGAPEMYKGEAAENEASNILASIASLTVESAAGKHEQERSEVEPENAPQDAKIENAPNPAEIATKAADARTAVHGEKPEESHDKTRQPIKETVFNLANQSMRVLSDITDTYERFEK